MLTLIAEKQCDIDKTSLPVPENELISLEQFKKNFEDAIFEDLGIIMTL